MKKFLVLIISMVYLLSNILSPSKIYANTVYSEYEYSLIMPQNWVGYVTPEKENFGYNEARILEKVNFYYEPQHSNNKRIFLMSVYVFFKSDWDTIVQKNSYTYLKETEKYVFAYTKTKTNPYTNKQDKEKFDRFIINAADTEIVKGMIRIQKKQVNTITVNGKVLSGKSIIKQGKTTYIPLRESLEALGYSVKWNNSSRSVNVSKGSYSTTLYLDEKKSPYKIIMENNSIYCSVHYFISSIKASIEVDKNNNVSISK